MYTTDDVLEDLRAVVAEKGPEYIYSSGLPDPLSPAAPLCVYVDNGAPSCIVGHVLHRRGVSINSMRQFDPAGDPDGLGSGAMVVVPALIPDASQEAVDLLEIAQSLQDNQKSWGAALAAAEAYAQPHDDDLEWDSASLSWVPVEDSFRVL